MIDTRLQEALRNEEDLSAETRLHLLLRHEIIKLQLSLMPANNNFAEFLVNEGLSELKSCLEKIFSYRDGVYYVKGCESPSRICFAIDIDYFCVEAHLCVGGKEGDDCNYQPFMRLWQSCSKFDPNQRFDKTKIPQCLRKLWENWT